MPGILCAVSRPVKGKAFLQVTTNEETSDSSVSCRQVEEMTKQDIQNLTDFEIQATEVEIKDDQEAKAFRSVFARDTSNSWKDKQTSVYRFFDFGRECDFLCV